MSNFEPALNKGQFKPFETALKETELFPLRAIGIEVLQINVGKLCNLSCKHCHVEAGPEKIEVMKKETFELCLNILKNINISTIDLTGGSPEMNPNLKWFIKECYGLDEHIIIRSNLTILLEPEFEDLQDFYADHQIEIIASLPYYLERTVDLQRGQGIFRKSIQVLKKLNEIGYGDKDTGLVLNLVYNPTGAFLPPPQHAIEADFKRELSQRYGIKFNNLFTMTNMPIGRFCNFLLRSGNYESYMQRLINAYNPQAASEVMCRYTLSVGWDGMLYDCDFNQMLAMSCNHGAPKHLRDFNFAKLKERRIVTGLHCYGCTAGSGSSCGGAVV